MWFCRKQSQKRNANHARNETYNQSLKGIEMLVLARKKHEETIVEVPVELMKRAIEENRPIVIRNSIVEVKNNIARLGWEAEKDVSIRRKEIMGRDAA